MDGIEQILQHFLIKAAFKISLKYEITEELQIHGVHVHLILCIAVSLIGRASEFHKYKKKISLIF